VLVFQEEETVSVLLKEAEEIMGPNRVIAAEDFLSVTVPLRSTQTKNNAEETTPNLAIFKQSSALKRDHAENSDSVKKNGEQCDRTYEEKTNTKRLKIEGSK
jgi:hypothetical protein